MRHNNQYIADGNSWFTIPIPHRFDDLIESLAIKEEEDFVITFDENNTILSIHTIESINKLISIFGHTFTTNS